jgi:hypothetical protein
MNAHMTYPRRFLFGVPHAGQNCQGDFIQTPSWSARRVAADPGWEWPSSLFLFRIHAHFLGVFLKIGP